MTFIFNHREILGSLRLEMCMVVKYRLLLFSHAESHSEITCRMKTMETLVDFRGIKSVSSGQPRLHMCLGSVYNCPLDFWKQGKYNVYRERWPWLGDVLIHLKTRLNYQMLSQAQ